MGTFSATGFGYTLYNAPGLDDSSVFAGISFPGVGPFSVQDQFDSTKQY